MKRPPTDLELLEEIYRRYYTTFVSFDKAAPSRRAKVLVPIDIKALANHFSVDPDIIFGRLYYHLDPKYRFTQDDGSKVEFFGLGSGEERHCVQFPLLSSVVATLREERNKHLWATWLSILALIISVASIVYTWESDGKEKEPSQMPEPTPASGSGSS